MKPGMILYREELGLILFMTDEEIAESMRLLARRFLFDEEPETENDHVDTFLQIAIPKQEADEQKYEKRIANASKGGSNSQANSKRNSSDTQVTLKRNSSDTQVTLEQNSSKTQVPLNKQEQEQEQEHKQEQELYMGKRARAFIPPTVEEVRAYCQSRGNGISAEQFVDHYSANGWSVGKNKMKDWKAAVRNWERNEFHKPVQAMSSHDWDYKALEEAAFRKALE